MSDGKSQTTTNEEAIQAAFGDMIYLGVGFYRQIINEDGAATLQHVPFDSVSLEPGPDDAA